MIAPAASCTAGVIVFVSCLEDFPSDELMAGLTLHSKVNLKILFTVGSFILADILSSQDLPACLAFEAAQMPLPFESQQSLAILDISTAACTIAGAADIFGTGRHRLYAALTKTVFPIKGNSISCWKWVFADGANEAGWMVGLPQSSDHLSLYEIPTAVTAGPMQELVVQSAQIVSVLHKEPTLSKVTATDFAGEAFDMEVL